MASPEWLSAILSGQRGDLRVNAVQTLEVLATQATKVRLALDIVEDGEASRIQICIKGVLTDTGASSATSIMETLFYRDLADAMPVRRPERLYAQMSADNSRGVVVMRDLIADGAHFCTALSPFTADAAAEGLEQLAALHVAGAASTPAYESPWIGRFLDRVAEAPILSVADLQALLDGPRGTGLPPALLSAERLHRAIALLADYMRAEHNCLLHGDAHAGNVYRDAEGRLGLVDWQVIQKGHWAQDVAYHIAAVLTPEDRRTHERQLLDHYIDHVKALGGQPIDREKGWHDYRLGMVYGYYLWSITRKVEPQITHEFVRRLGTAVADLESFEALNC
ncbi:phosphotransferase [Sphingobium tyrosinilyticum]|uniref:Phosphotransferase n=1 Tax=Sphingobium tyrosinilyticum TaxID=2715436 RepID=A0ABV9F4M2_9SPHN